MVSASERGVRCREQRGGGGREINTRQGENGRNSSKQGRRTTIIEAYTNHEQSSIGNLRAQ